MLDPITTGIIVVLGKYALDKGAELGAEVGPKALDTAKEMASSALNYLRRRGSDSEFIAKKYEENPTIYEEPLKEELSKAVESDPALKAELEALLRKFDEEAEAYAAEQGTTYTAVLKGSGAIAQGEGATAVGERGVNVGGSAGPIITGSGNTITIGRSAASSISLPADLAPLRDNLTTYFNRSELKSLCFDLGVASDDLPGETRSELAQALVEHCYERDRLSELLSRCQAERPNVNWQ